MTNWNKESLPRPGHSHKEEQREAAILEGEAWFQTVLNGINDAIFIHDAKTGAILDVNDKMCEMYGYTRNQVRHVGVEALSSGETPYTQTEAMGWMKKALEEGPQLFEWRAKDKQGHLFWVEVNMRRAVIGDQDRILAAVRDIGDRKRAEEALAEERALLRTLMDNLPDLIYVKDQESRFVLVNKAVAEFMGAPSPEELIGRTDFEFYPYELATQYYADEQTIFQSGQSLMNKEEFNQDREGNQRWVLSTKIPLQNSAGNVIGLVGLGHDITVRKQAETALVQSQANLQTLFDSLQDFLFVVDYEELVRHVNPPVLKRLGYQEEELVGSPMAKVHPPDRQEEAKAIIAAMIAEKIDSCSIPLLCKDGTLIPVETKFTKGHWSGEDMLFGISRDITERKKAEAEREQLLSDLIYRSTQLVTAAEISTSASRLLEPEQLISEAVDLIQQRFQFYYVGLFLTDEASQYAVLQAGTGQAGRKMIAEGHKLAVGGESMIGQCVATAQARIALDVGEEAVRFQNPNLPRTRSEMALPLISRGECIGALTVQSTEEAAFSVDDVAVLQSMADQLAIALTNARLYDQVQRYATRLEDLVSERTADLAAVNKELEAFAYSVSHDLRAPLRSIDGFSQALLEDYENCMDATGQNYLHRVRAASQRMGQLIDDLLNLSRLTRQEIERERIDLSALVRIIAADLQEQEPERKVEFVIEEGVVTTGDGHLLQIALEKLISNAWKFTSKHPRARIEFGVADCEGQTAYFVRDDGVGFDMAYAHKLFGAFQRLHGVAEFEGSGIGLATAQRIIHRHGGRIWAKGVVGQGATFYFTLATKKGKER
jgi:PAS domain S-box-containing protein